MTTPTQEQKRVMIAEVCGWTNIADISIEKPGQWMFGYPPGITDVAEKLPDYFADLDAMREAEKTLLDTFGKMNDYEDKLGKWCLRPNRQTPYYWEATATQRAEALGISMNLWPA